MTEEKGYRSGKCIAEDDRAIVEAQKTVLKYISDYADGTIVYEVDLLDAVNDHELDKTVGMEYEEILTVLDMLDNDGYVKSKTEEGKSSSARMTVKGISEVEGGFRNIDPRAEFTSSNPFDLINNFHLNMRRVEAAYATTNEFEQRMESIKSMLQDLMDKLDESEKTRAREIIYCSKFMKAGHLFYRWCKENPDTIKKITGFGKHILPRR